jgi:hypothetical protein
MNTELGKAEEGKFTIYLKIPSQHFSERKKNITVRWNKLKDV